MYQTDWDNYEIKVNGNRYDHKMCDHDVNNKNKQDNDVRCDNDDKNTNGCDNDDNM